MSLYKEYLLNRAANLHNYAHRPPAGCDLSLISGPFIWQAEVGRVLGQVPQKYLQAYALPAEDPELLGILSEFEDVDPTCLLLTPGADLAIEIVLKQFLSAGDRIGILVPNFPRFEIVAGTFQDLEIIYCQDLESIPAGLQLVAVCTPNNPSTAEVPLDKLQSTVAAHPDTLFCVDAVFDWYSPQDTTSLTRDFSNVIVLKSFSKIGLAGLRLGYTIARPESITYLRVGMSPFTVPAVVQAVGQEIARHLHRVEEICSLLEDRVQLLEREFGPALKRECALPFYLLETRFTSTQAADLLAEEGISVVDGILFRGLGEYRLRVAIGSEEENQLLLQTVHRLNLV